MATLGFGSIFSVFIMVAMSLAKLRRGVIAEIHIADVM